MSQRNKYAPKHRNVVSVTERPKKAVRKTVLASSLAVAATGVAVAGGLGASGGQPQPMVVSSVADEPIQKAAGAPGGTASEGTANDASGNELANEALERHAADTSSRSDRRDALDSDKAEALTIDEGRSVAHEESLSDDDPRDIAKSLLPEFGFSSSEFTCLDSLYMSESGWDVSADNPTSSAYGIPQALPGEKMASAGPDWETNPVTQIKWGLGYIADRYGTPCGAWSFKQGAGWY